MKKFTTVVMVLVILVMSLTLTAHAETRVVDFANSVKTVCDEDGKFCGFEHHYYLTLYNDTSETFSEVEVPYEVYIEALKEKNTEEERYNSRIDVQVCRWTAQAACDVWDFVTFWD
jgi:hypothetical protein